MADGEEAACPQVFVLDGQSNCDSRQRSQTTGPRGGQQVLLLLVGMVALGLVIQGVFIYDLYKKTKALSHNRSPPHYLNVSDAKAFAQQSKAVARSPGLSEIQILQLYQKQEEQRPFAHLTGDNAPLGEKNVLQWISDSDDNPVYHMSYNRSCLQVKKEGYYYLYSKVYLQNCAFVHMVMKNTTEYAEPIELLKSKSFRLPKNLSAKAQDLWNSFLCGIFHLRSGDIIYVMLGNVQGSVVRGYTENFMGAFMVVPWTY